MPRPSSSPGPSGWPHTTRKPLWPALDSYARGRRGPRRHLRSTHGQRSHRPRRRHPRHPPTPAIGTTPHPRRGRAHRRAQRNPDLLSPHQAHAALLLLLLLLQPHLETLDSALVMEPPGAGLVPTPPAWGQRKQPLGNRPAAVGTAATRIKWHAVRLPSRLASEESSIRTAGAGAAAKCSNRSGPHRSSPSSADR